MPTPYPPERGSFNNSVPLTKFPEIRTSFQ